MEKNNLLSETFKWLFIGLLVCFGVSYCCSLNDDVIYTVYGSFNGYGYLIFAALELILAVVFIAGIRKYTPTTAKILYLAYAALTGLSLTGIFILYVTSSICFVFLTTGIVMGIFAFIGKKTNLDLKNFGVYLLIALLAIIILELINIFIMNSTIDLALSIITIIVFCGYIAYDVNMLLKSNYLDDTDNKAIYFAFQLFLDFINVFIKLLRLLGKRRD